MLHNSTIFSTETREWIWPNILSWKRQYARYKSTRFSTPQWVLRSPAQGVWTCWSNSWGRSAACLNSCGSHGLRETLTNLQSGGYGSLCATEKGSALALSTGGITAAGLGNGLWVFGGCRGSQRKGYNWPLACLTPPASFYKILFTLRLFCGKKGKY